MSDCISLVHCCEPQLMTSLAVKSITHVSGAFCGTGFASHPTTVSAGSSLMVSHSFRSPSPKKAPHHAPLISWNRIPVAVSSVHTAATAMSGVTWDLRFVDMISSGSSVWMNWPARAPAAISRMMTGPMGTKLVGPLGAELVVVLEGPWDDDDSVVVLEGSAVVVEDSVVLATDVWDDDSSIIVLKGSAVVKDSVMLAAEVWDVSSEVEVGAGMLVGSSSDVEGSDVEGSDVTTVEEVLKKPEKDDVRRTVEKDPVLLIKLVWFANRVKLEEDGAGEGSVLDSEEEEKGKRTVSVTTGTAAVVVVGPAPMQEQALSKRYDTSP